MKSFYGSFKSNIYFKTLIGWLVILMINITLPVHAAVEVDDLWFPDFVDVEVVSMV